MNIISSEIIQQGINFVAFPMPVRTVLVLTFIALCILCLVNFAMGIKREKAISNAVKKERMKNKEINKHYEYNKDRK